jgi:penicillin amidase
MQLDTLSLRAVEAVPPLLAILDGVADARLRAAAVALRSWNKRMEPEETGAAIFELFFNQWCQAVAAERFPPAAVPTVAGAMGGLALALLSEDRAGWFAQHDRTDAVVQAFRHTVDNLEGRFGPDPSHWTWARVHGIALRHVLSGRGELGRLLDRGGVPVRGSGVTVCNTGYDPNYMASIGANYRLIADLATSPPGLWAVDAAGASGDPGNPHYCDQLPEWLAGRHHFLVLDRAQVERETSDRLRLDGGRPA